MRYHHSQPENIKSMLKVLDSICAETWVNEAYGGENILNYSCGDISSRLNGALKAKQNSNEYSEAVTFFLRLIRNLDGCLIGYELSVASLDDLMEAEEVENEDFKKQAA